MPWFNQPESLSYKIYKIYTDTASVFIRPKISDLFDDGRRKIRAELLHDLLELLKKVYELEKKSNGIDDYEFDNH